MFEIELIICLKMDLALNNLQSWYATKPTNQPTNQPTIIAELRCAEKNKNKQTCLAKLRLLWGKLVFTKMISPDKSLKTKLEREPIRNAQKYLSAFCWFWLVVIDLLNGRFIRHVNPFGDILCQEIREVRSFYFYIYTYGCACILRVFF